MMERKKIIALGEKVLDALGDTSPNDALSALDIARTVVIAVSALPDLPQSPPGVLQSS
jgi:hypothetical protein